MTTLIYGGRLIDPANRVDSKLNILIENGRVALVTDKKPDADEVIDAGGRIVCPGFIDIHMHEDPVEDGKIYSDPDKAIFGCMLRMGVTTAVGGNCGLNTCDPGEYLDLVDKSGAYVNVAMLAGHAWFRTEAGAHDKYAPASESQMQHMAEHILASLRRGCLGVSYGIRYVPGINEQEMLETAAPCTEQGKLIAAHVRSDAEEIFDSVREFLDVGRALKLPTQVSHIGSMGGFGQMQRVLDMVNTYRLNGLDVMCDCYPYAAFSTAIGSATYDEGWMERYNCGYDAVELCEGEFKGQRCTKEIFESVRKNDPECLTVCYVMKPEDIELAMRDPGVMLASDGIMSHGQGHPRAAGAFPRVFAQYVRQGRISLYDAVGMMTAAPAARLGLNNKGRLSVGADADIVIFDENTIADKATFSDPVIPSVGIDYVLIGGRVAAKDCRVVRPDLGRSIRK